MADPHQHSEAHHHTKHTHRTQSLNLKHAPKRDSVVIDGIPGKSEDGYNFFTKAEPILLEIESRVSTFEKETLANRKQVSGFPHNRNFRNKHHRMEKTNDDFQSTRALEVTQTDTTTKPESAGPGKIQSGDAFDVHAHLSARVRTEKAQVTGQTTPAHSTPLQKVYPLQNTKPAKSNSSPQSNSASKASAKANVATQVSGVVGSGELLSDFQTTPGVSINPCQQDSTHPCIASMDSGHSLISGPPELIRRLKELTTPSGACTEEATMNMPDVSFVIGGKLFTLTPMDYLIELEGHCTPAFRERPFRNGHDWVLGEHFMRTFYSVFDYDDMRVGLARIDNIKQHLDTILSRE